jgi:hypothetical protein
LSFRQGGTNACAHCRRQRIEHDRSQSLSSQATSTTDRGDGCLVDLAALEADEKNQPQKLGALFQGTGCRIEQGLEPATRRILDDRSEERFLVLEMPIDGASREARPLLYGSDAGSRKAPLGHQSHGSVHDPSARLEAAFLPAGGPARDLAQIGLLARHPVAIPSCLGSSPGSDASRMIVLQSIRKPS